MRRVIDKVTVYAVRLKEASVQGLVTFTITVTNSEGKPQPNITLQIKPGNEVKTFKTNACLLYTSRCV